MAPAGRHDGALPDPRGFRARLCRRRRAAGGQTRRRGSHSTRLPAAHRQYGHKRPRVSRDLHAALYLRRLRGARMLTGAHAIIYSSNADADRAFFRDVLKLENVDVGGGWLIFALPPAEVAVHPAQDNDRHELYLMCADVAAFVADMKKRGIACSAVQDERWGLLTQLTLPGGGKIGVYQPRHPRP